MACRIVAPPSRSSWSSPLISLLGRLVHPGHRLIQQEDRCLLHQSARARNTRCCWPPERAPICRRAELGHRRRAPAHRAPRRRSLGAGAAQPADAGVSAHHHHLLRRSPGSPSRPPRAAGRRRAGPAARAASPADAHLAADLRRQAEDRLEERALARAVRPDDRGDRSRGKRQVDVAAAPAPPP